MNDRVLTAEDEPLATLLQNIRRTTKKAVRLTADYRPPLNGERYLTDREVAERLKSWIEAGEFLLTEPVEAIPSR